MCSQGARIRKHLTEHLPETNQISRMFSYRNRPRCFPLEFVQQTFGEESLTITGQINSLKSNPTISTYAEGHQRRCTGDLFGMRKL